MNFLKAILPSLIETVVHFIFWIAVYFFYTYYLGYGSSNTAYINNFSMYLLPSTIGVGYFFLYVLLPNYLFKKKYFLFVLYSIYTFIISFFFIVVSILYGMIFSVKFTNNGDAPLTRTIPYIIFGVYFIVMIIILFGLLRNNYQATLKSEDLKNKFLATQLQLKEQELKYLKMQIHPHFLFNTLNTMYGFALKKSDQTPEVILKLSSLLDYILYQVNKPKVLLKDEIQHIKNYISLEKIRFQDQLNIKFECETFQEEILIPPMLLLPFVENAFKHGARVDQKLTITLTLQLENDFLIFSCVNTTKKNKKERKGIGLENIEERLKRLFKNRYILSTNIESNLFHAHLKIPIENEKNI